MLPKNIPEEMNSLYCHNCGKKFPLPVEEACGRFYLLPCPCCEGKREDEVYNEGIQDGLAKAIRVIEREQ